MLRDPLHLAALIAGITALGFWLERRFAWGRKVGASLLIILMGALCANLNFVPLSSPVYDVVFGPITSLAIVWLLFSVDFRDLKSAGPVMLLAFLAAVFATAVGALTATLLFGDAFGENGWKLAGVMTGTYSGGSLNFVAVGRELSLPQSLFTAATAADNVMTAVWFAVTLALPVHLYRWLPPRRGETAARTQKSEQAAHPMFQSVEMRVGDLCWLGALGLALIVVAEELARLAPLIPSVLILTTLALLVAQIPAVRRLTGAFQLGLIALHLFFALIGIGSKLAEIQKVGFAILYFTATVVAVHGFILFLYARLRREDWDSLAVASQASVGGPSTALALAVSRGKPGLALPGIAVGLLGYALGTYAGFAVAWLTHGMN